MTPSNPGPTRPDHDGPDFHHPRGLTLGVGVAVSEGQVLVRLSTPRRGDYYAPGPDQDYDLSAAVDSGPLDLRGCGTGCFFAPTSWRNGGNVLTLQAGAAGWHGATISLLVPWPVRPGDEELSRAVTATREADRVTVYEAVTSDTSTGPPEPRRLDLDADFFVSQEPYAAGTAPQTVRISADGQPVRLALGYPAASVTVLLTLDDHGRIAEETLTDAKHLVTRRFVYPSHP